MAIAMKLGAECVVVGTARRPAAVVAPRTWRPLLEVLPPLPKTRLETGLIGSRLPEFLRRVRLCATLAAPAQDRIGSGSRASNYAREEVLRKPS